MQPEPPLAHDSALGIGYGNIRRFAEINRLVIVKISDSRPISTVINCHKSIKRPLSQQAPVGHICHPEINIDNFHKKICAPFQPYNSNSQF